MRLNPKADPAVRTVVASVNFAAGRTDKAVELWEQARAANTDLITARVPLAVITSPRGVTKKRAPSRKRSCA